MARAARGLGGELRGQVDEAADGGRWSLVLVAVLAVGREGLETALFLWAATQAGTREAPAPSRRPGSRCSAPRSASLTAVVLGYLIYRGAISINLSRFFTWTGAFLILVAAGVLAYGVHDLQEAGILPGLNNLAFDVSDTIDPGTWYGTLLKGIFNFSPATTVLEAAVWVLYVVPVDDCSSSSAYAGARRPRPVRPRRPRADPRRALTARHLPRPARTRRPMRLLPLLALAAGRARSSPPAPRTPTADDAGRRDDPHDRGRARPTTACERLGHRGAGRHADLRRHQHRLAGHRVLPARRGRPADRRRGREHRPRAHPRAGRQRARRHVRHRLQAGHEGRRHPRPTSPSPSPTTPAERRRRRPGAGRRRREPNYAAYVQDQSDQLLAKTRAVRRGSTRPATTTRPARSTPSPACTGSGSSPSPSPSATSTRRWTPARRTSSPARSGPAGTGSRRTCGPQRADELHRR